MRGQSCVASLCPCADGADIADTTSSAMATLRVVTIIDGGLIKVTDGLWSMWLAS